MNPSVLLVALSHQYNLLSSDQWRMAQSWEDNDERVLLGDEWRVEALAIIRDVQDHVEEMKLACIPTCTDKEQTVYLNLTTRERDQYCVELTAQGFRVVGRNYDSKDLTTGVYFETPYALLDNLSPMYRQAFGDSLAQKLAQLTDRPPNEDPEPV